MKSNKGITLIALIITIIVMLILVAVTISMAVNGGLFGYAGNAARGTEAEKQKETRLANVQSNLSTNALIDYYTKGEVEMATFTWTGEFGEEDPVPYQFEVGMTWEEWINSSYNEYVGTFSGFEMRTYNGNSGQYSLATCERLSCAFI